MQSSKKSLLLPVLLITVGTGWLLTTLGVVPGVDWVWTLGLATVGFLTLAIGGIDKATVVMGPLFIAASLMSVLRQTDRLSFEVEIPVLVILIGALMLLARSSRVPTPAWAVAPVGEDLRDSR